MLAEAELAERIQDVADALTVGDAEPALAALRSAVNGQIDEASQVMVSNEPLAAALVSAIVGARPDATMLYRWLYDWFQSSDKGTDVDEASGQADSSKQAGGAAASASAPDAAPTQPSSSMASGSASDVTSACPATQLFVLRLLPALLHMFLETRVARPALNATLLCVYNDQVVRRDGRPLMFREPSLDLGSVLHRTTIAEADSLVARGAASNNGSGSSSSKKLGRSASDTRASPETVWQRALCNVSAVTAGNRLHVVRTVLHQYSRMAHLLPDTSLVLMCAVAIRMCSDGYPFRLEDLPSPVLPSAPIDATDSAASADYLSERVLATLAWFLDLLPGHAHAAPIDQALMLDLVPVLSLALHRRPAAAPAAELALKTVYARAEVSLMPQVMLVVSSVLTEYAETSRLGDMIGAAAGVAAPASTAAVASVLSR